MVKMRRSTGSALMYLIEVEACQRIFLCCCYNRHTLMTILPWYVGTCQERVLDEVTLHTLISSLAAWHEEFTHADFCDLVFDQFLLLLVSNLSVLRHTLRLLWYVLPKMDPQKVVHILTITQPSSEVGSTAQLTIETSSSKDDDATQNLG